MSRSYDVIVWGSTGFSGKIVCKYLSSTFPTLRWAIAGRNESKLNEIKSALNLSVPVLLADLNDPNSLDSIFKKAIVVLSTAGPFAQIGTPIVASCVRTKTNYCDITGEAQWVRTIIDQFHEQAKEKKIKIVNCCGFDCIPCDLSVQMMIEEMEIQGIRPEEVRLIVRDMKGAASGGTIASVFNMVESSPISVLKEFKNPFYLNPRDVQTNKIIAGAVDPKAASKCADSFWFSYDSNQRKWVVPWLMQAIDTRIVHRSNALSSPPPPPPSSSSSSSSSSSQSTKEEGWRYGKNFIYSERWAVPNFLVAFIFSVSFIVGGLFVVVPFLRPLAKLFLPKQGEGPSNSVMENGYCKMTLWGKGRKKINKKNGEEEKQVVLQGCMEAMMGDPGYKETAKMVSEAAVALARGGVDLGENASKDFLPLPSSSGVLTPAVALGAPLRKRLTQQGIQFRIISKGE